MNKDIKPIVVMYFPYNYGWDSSGRTVDVMPLMRELNGSSDRVRLDSKYAEYIWFCFYKEEITEPELKVFYPKDFTEIQYQELKDMLSEAIKTLTNEPK